MQYKINKPIRMLELFSGYMSQSLALKYLGVNFESYKTSEWERNAIAAAHAIHFPNDTTDYSEGMTKDELVSYLVEFGISNDGKSPMEEKSVARKGEKWLRETYNDIQATHNIGSVLNIHAEDLEIVDKDKYEYMLTYSFPCAPKGTLVKTINGYKDISEITDSDYVLTHTNSYQKVVKTMSRISDHINHIKANGCNDLYLTDEHPLYVLRDNEIQWIKVKELTTSDYVCFNVNTKSVPSKCSDDILWLVGRYIADGHINKYTHNSVNFAIANAKEEEFKNHIPEEFKNKFKVFPKTGIQDYRIADEDFWELCYEFNTGSTDKELPQWIIDMPVEQCKVFLDGYFSGDGHLRVKGRGQQMMFCTASHKLFLGLQEMIMKVYGCVSSAYVRHDERKDTFNDTWNGQFYIDQKHTTQKTIGNQIFTRVKSIERTETEIEVFNFEVDIDNSYTTNGVVVHNCQDLSLAGKQRGMDKGSDTRSALLWEVERVLIECNEKNCLPQILLMENVTQVHGTKNIDNFNTWLSFLESLGYSNYWEDLNAKDFTVPQNRNRCFCISILGDYEYEFPKPVELKKRLKDVLEDEVDESYYINTEKAETLIGSLIDKGILPSQTNTYSLKNMGSSDENRIPDGERSDVAHTLMARDWKGLNNYGSNGVIEKEQIGIDLTTNNPQSREVSNCLKAGCRGITNFAQDETGVAESVS